LNGSAASLDAARKSSWTNGNTTMSAAENLIADQPLRAGQALVDRLELVTQRLRRL